MGIYAELYSLVDQFRNQNRDMNNRIKALGNTIDHLCIEAKEKVFPDVPTDKDRPFRVGDTIAFWDGMCDDIRIVLEVKSDKLMRLMNVPSGDIRGTLGHPDNYTLVYRPGSPKPEPTVKEKIVTDRFGKPEGGLEPGDVFDFDSHYYGKNVSAIFIQQTPHQRTNGWIEGQRIVDGERIVIGNDRNPKFKFRPQFPDRKER